MTEIIAARLGAHRGGWLAAITHDAAPVEDTSHGSARWAHNRDLWLSDNAASDLCSDRLTLGWSTEPAPLPKQQSAALAVQPRPRLGFGRAEHYPLVVTGPKLVTATGARPDGGHILTIAGTGAGRGMAAVTPNLMTYQGSVVVLDPRGEYAADTVGARLALGQRVCLVDPFGVAPREIRDQFLTRFNPLAALHERWLAGEHSEVFDEAGAIADMLILTTDPQTQPHWSDAARSFLRAAILFVAYATVYQDRERYPLNLLTVHDCILSWFQSTETIRDFARICRTDPHLSMLAGEVSMIATEERASVLSDLLKHTEFLSSPNVAESLGLSDFSAADLKRTPMSVYLILPADRLATDSRLARLWIGALLQEMLRTTDAPPWQVLFFLDEMARLGAMDTLREAVSLARGYGVDLWMLFQDIRQVKNAYGEGWQTFVANARVQQFFGIRDHETAEWIARRLSRSTGRALLQPDDVMCMADDEQILLIGEQDPVRAHTFDLRLPQVRAAVQALTL